MGTANTVRPGDSGGPLISAAAASDAQLEALRDGNVSQVEYQGSFERFARCAQQAGYAVEFVGVSNDVIEYRMSDGALQAREVENCYAREFQSVDMSWQLAHEDTSAGAVQAEKCLRQWKLNVPAKYAERLKVLENAGIDMATCKKT